MCRTVSDAVYVLDVIVGYDELDAEATGAASKYIPHGGFMQFLRIQGLKAKRIGVLDVFFQGYDDMQLAVYEKHLDTTRYSLRLLIHDAISQQNYANSRPTWLLILY